MKHKDKVNASEERTEFIAADYINKGDDVTIDFDLGLVRKARKI